MGMIIIIPSFSEKVECFFAHLYGKVTLPHYISHTFSSTDYHKWGKSLKLNLLKNQFHLQEKKKLLLKSLIKNIKNLKGTCTVVHL